ncbi:UHRF1-binding protein 1-like [Schistosoma japonicum]|nr:UHRF1-binding protein 1-like [Schistosoma japonicum]
MSLLKGILELEALELEENALMELLDLPTWLLLRKAHCTNVVAKIHWTKLKTHPILISIDHISIELQALDEPRLASDSPVANYRNGSGKYGFSDKVIDGVTIQVNSVFIKFFAQAFQGSVELSRFCVVSKSPNWRNCLLDLTTLILPQYDSILIFKEVSWESARIVADGLLTVLRGIPVKLITNQARVRLIMKKRLSDGALISSRIRLLLDDLLWVFTLSQVEAAIVFARSLEHSIRLASEQSKRFAADKAMRQTVTMSSSSKTQSLVNNNNSANCTSNNHTQSTVTAQNSATKRTEDYVNAVNLFHQYDVLETSYHLTISRTELHFCDETKEKIQLNPNIVPNGSIRVNLTTLSIDWYPYHLDILSELPWPGCREFHSARDNWLKGINPIHFTNGRLFSTNSSTVTDNQFVILDCGLLQTMNTSVLQSVGILRLVDITVSCVSYPKSLLKPDNSSTLFLKSSQNHKTFFSTCAANNARIQTEIPVDRNLFIGSDKLLHNLPDASPFLTVELRNHYSVDDTSSGSLPCLLFCQVNPFYINFDPDTVIWLNIFLLTLQLNLLRFQSTFLLRKNKCSLKQPNRLFDLNRYHVRFEALMPRLIFSLFDRYNRDANLSKWIGPHALVIQADQIIIQSLAAPISSHVADRLKKLLDNLQSNCSHFGANFVNTSPFNSKSVPHKSPDILMFQKLIESATELHSLLPNFDEQFWCIHCPNVWSEFLTVIDVLHPPNHPVNNDRINSSTIYRQSLIESFPLTVWSLVPINIPVSTTANNNDHQSNNSPISLIIDIDNKLNPMDSSSLSSPHVINQSIKFSLGSVDQLSTNRILLPHIIKFCITDHEKLKIPDALDQIIFMYHIYQQISYVQSHLCLNYQEFAEITKSRFTSSINPQSNHNAYHQLFYCVGFSTQRSIEFNINICHHSGGDNDMNQISSPNSTENNIDTSLLNTPNMSSTNVKFFPNKSLSSTSLSSSSSTASSAKCPNYPTPPSTAASLLPLSSQTSLRHHHSILEPSWDSLSLKAESPILSGGKLNKTIFRQSISGRIHSTDDSPRSLVLRNDSDRCIGTADKNDGSKRSNKLLYSSSPSPKAFLTKYQTNSSISSINRKVCNSTCRDKPLQNKPFSEQNIFALNPVVNDTWTNNSSTNNISEQFSISSDLSDLQGISNSIDDWTEPFEVLSKLRSSSTNENNDILCSPRDHIIDNQYGHFHSSLNHQQCNHLRNSSSFLLGPDEIGSELLDNFSTCTSNPTETTKPVTVEMCKHSEPERNDTDQEKFRLWKISNISSVIINLTGFSCEADATNLEARFWIMFKSLRLFMKPEETFDCSITSSSCYHFGQQQNDDFVQSDYLWSIFLSFGGDPTVGLIKLNPANDNYPWLCINAILLRNWQVIIPSTIEQLIFQVWHQINIHKGIDQLNGGNSSIHNNNNSPNTSPPKRSIRLLLKQGSLTLKLASNTKEDLEQLKLFKELFLQQGLIIELTKNGIFQITSDQCTMNIEEFSTTGSTSDDHYLHDNKSLSSYTAINPSNTFHNILINRYASENKLLKDKIDALTIELMKYKLLHND